jgi:hypothetical protein
MIKWSQKEKKNWFRGGKSESNGKNGRTGLTEAFEPHLNWGRICLAGCGEYTALSPRESGMSIWSITHGCGGRWEKGRDALVFWQFGIKVDAFHAHELETLIDYRRTQLVDAQFDAQEESWAA